MIQGCATEPVLYRRNIGFTLVEQIITLGISSIILATIFMAYNISLGIFDDQLTATQLRGDLRDAAETMKKDLRNANSLTYPAAPGLLTTFVLDSDGQTYSYYINANKFLVRQKGTTGVGGRSLAHNLDSASSTITKVGDLIIIDLRAAIDHHEARISSSVKPRNI